MRRKLKSIGYTLLSGFVSLAVCSCVSADGNPAAEQSVTEVSENVPEGVSGATSRQLAEEEPGGKERNETHSALRRSKQSYNNDLARTLIDKLSTSGTLTDEEYIQAVEMDEQGNAEVYGALIEAVRKASSGEAMIALIDNIQQESRVKYKYLRQLHLQLLKAAKGDDMPKALGERVQQTDADIRAKVQLIDSLSVKTKGLQKSSASLNKVLQQFLMPV